MLILRCVFKKEATKILSVGSLCNFLLLVGYSELNATGEMQLIYAIRPTRVGPYLVFYYDEPDKPYE